MATATTRVRSVQGDTVDLICWRTYGRTAGITEQVLEANPGLADLGAELPIGTLVTLPAQPALRPSPLAAGRVAPPDAPLRRAVAAGLQFVGDLLVVLQTRQPGALDRRDVDEHVLAAVIRLDEAVALGGVEPFHSAGSHFQDLRKQFAAGNSP